MKEYSPFAFAREDRWLINQVIVRVRSLLAKSDLSPRTILSLARIILGLERLPRATPGLDVHLSFQYRYGTAASSFDLALSGDEFRLFGSTLENIGSLDAFTTYLKPFAIESGGYRADPNESDWYQWIEGFGLCEDAILKIDDASDDFLDWDDWDSSGYWERISGERP